MLCSRHRILSCLLGQFLVGVSTITHLCESFPQGFWSHARSIGLWPLCPDTKWFDLHDFAFYLICSSNYCTAILQSKWPDCRYTEIYYRITNAFVNHSFSLDYSVHPCNRDTFNYLCFCWNKDLRRSRTIKIVRCYKSFISHENYRLVVINSSVQRSNFFFQMQNSFHSASHKLFNKRHHVKSLKRIFKHRTISL